MINIITEDHTLLYSSLTMSLDYSMYLQPLIAFSLTALKERGLKELSWESEEYRCCLQQVEIGRSESYKLYILFIAPGACTAIEASLRCRILFGVIRTILGPYDLVYRGVHSPLQQLSQPISVLDAVMQRTSCLLRWEPGLSWPLPLALPTIHCTLMQTGMLFNSLGTILTETHRDVMSQACTLDARVDSLQDLRANIILSTRIVAFLDTQLLDITSCEPSPKGILPRDYLSHADYLSMLVHSSLYTKLHSILTDKWGDSKDFSTVNPQKDANCILDKFIGVAEEKELDSEEVSEYFHRGHHVMNLTCQGSEVTSIIVRQTLGSQDDHGVEKLRSPIFTLFYCVLMTSNLVQQLEQRYQNDLEAFASVVQETLHSGCFPRARELFSVMFPPLYIQACHPLKAMTAHYLHAVTHNKCLAFIASNHTSKETLTHSILGLLEEASYFMPPSDPQQSRDSLSNEESCPPDMQIHQMRAGVESVKTTLVSMFCFRHNCMEAGLRFSARKQKDKMIVFWMTYIYISDQTPGVQTPGKTKAKGPRMDSVPQEIVDYTIPGTQMASYFTILKTPLYRRNIQDMCISGTYPSNNGYFSDSTQPPGTEASRKASLDLTPKRSTSTSKSSMKSSQHNSSAGQSRAGSAKRSLLRSVLRKTSPPTNSVIVDALSPSQAPEITRYYEAYYQAAHFIDMVAAFTGDTVLEEATSYMAQIFSKIVQNRYARGMFL